MSDLNRGGMCANPFGGEERIDRINLIDFLEPNCPPDKVLFLRIIQDAASNYLYAMLGKNGTSVDEFFYAHQYFFKINSTDKASWEGRRMVKNIYTDRGAKVYQKRVLEDNELKLMCFDRQFELSGLSDHMHIDRFRSSLKAKRRRVLVDNWDQVVAYVTALYQREVSQIVSGQQVPLQVWSDDLLTTLIDPPTPQHLANTIYISSKLKKQKKRRHSTNNVGIHSKLVERIENQTKTRLAPNWGPLAALLEGVGNVQSSTDDSSDSVLRSITGSELAASASNSG